MLGGYAKLGEFALARKVFDEMQLKDEVSWSTMILGLAQHGLFEEVFGYFQRLPGVATRPNECGSVDMARIGFERVPGKRSIVSWTTLITGLAMEGHGEEALALFHEMEGYGVEPDGTAFVALLYACAHAGLVEEGNEMFDKMSKLYRLDPEIEHYGCMVDLYGRAGQLTRAYEFVTQMPIPPNDVIWRTLLGACNFHGNVHLAEWRDAAAVRRSMAELKLRKRPGWSRIEVDKMVYTFVAGVRGDDATREAYEKLGEVMSRIQVEGGEKLAVAFGMARSGGARRVRVVKNLRVCRDCHNVMKLISKVYELEIVLREE
ncbi:hypothetical protein SASPL_151476 [Salvia splendens]|uniref:DYW domain-containing protein n=1 Tax=Salvia splendens TaxID=180675 RepID=A0A8X8W7V6_SALSN|nr:hypothetical protein SASPL_151476 [Salvia splendens]